MEHRKAYPADLTDFQYDLICCLLPPEKAKGTRGREQIYSHRELLNAILYHLRVGGAWRTLPHDLPHWNSVYAYFRRWSEEGTLDRIQDKLRTLVRRQAGKEPLPSAVILDSETIKTTDKGGNRSSRALVTTPISRSRAANATSP